VSFLFNKEKRSKKEMRLKALKTLLLSYNIQFSGVSNPYNLYYLLKLLKTGFPTIPTRATIPFALTGYIKIILIFFYFLS